MNIDCISSCSTPELISILKRETLKVESMLDFDGDMEYSHEELASSIVLMEAILNDLFNR